MTGPLEPQPLVPAPAGPHLPHRQAPGPARLWWMGVHGGAGESTLAALSADGAPAEHAWPVAGTGQHTVVLVARTHHHGLTRARQAATEWASGQVPVRLLGLVLVPDGPGRTPKPLKELAALVAGAVPRLWHIPWVEAWRLAPASPETAPRAVRRVLAQTAQLMTA
ncbi:DUF6668 family protein [Nocardiopsis baichengensis]|uniref:DUF6668 family protein n=1 Tax=Nocardiopsis baichengensis TaxID=280240 RepID=UPI00038188EC|nr:DUF6668 family protein [Nocardiopsis baichengensis]